MSSRSRMSTDDNVAQFCGVTGATAKEAKKFLDKHKRLEYALNAFYNDPQSVAAVSRRTEPAPSASTSKLSALFDKYKDPDGEDINVDGTIAFCQDLEVDPEDVVLLTLAYELKSPRVGEWTKKGWTDGWKKLGVDAIPAMKSKLETLKDKLGRDPKYFQQVYSYTFDFARSEGQRSLSLENAQAYWSLLLPHGIENGALHRVRSTENDDDEDQDMEELGPGFKSEYVDWWFEFLQQRGGKGVTKDTWAMLLEFVRTIDDKFEEYDAEAAWPSTIDDFVEYAKQRLTA